MGMALVLTGEVQVDIRLLISLKSKERLKWNVKVRPFSAWSTAPGIPYPAYHIRTFREILYLFEIKIGIIMAFRAVIMRDLGVYLRNSRHSWLPRTNRQSLGTNQISVLIGLPHQLLGDDVHHGESIGNDGVQLPLQTLHNDLRQIFAI